MIETDLEYLESQSLVERIWERDHTVWQSTPTEITNRLGWLNVTDYIGRQIHSLQAFTQEIREDGFRHVVLLGMGGSSLGPHVISQTFGNTSGFPDFLVMDSTVPKAILAATEKINLVNTLFLVSSKSGTTTESLVLYKYFRELLENAIGKENAGGHFVSITDPGTHLESLAYADGFRRIFQNPADIGGRYSILSYFGIVPAALIGIDIPKLLCRADLMRNQCASLAIDQNNPGAWLGAFVGTMALLGRNKLTLVTSPSIACFGLWAEQLIAESTGKEGKGIIPVVNEPMLDPTSYKNDRMFVYMRLDDDNNTNIDASIADIEASGQPVLHLRLRDLYDLGAEFFRWEFATAIAAAILGVHPFDQPNIQQTKDYALDSLENPPSSEQCQHSDSISSITNLLSAANTGDYLAIMAYIHQTPETDRALSALRRSITENHYIPTTLGYGPRFLHSTGQIHKGGPNNGLFFQITTEHDVDIPIPNKPYTFGVLTDAQSMSDLKVFQDLERRVAMVRLPSDLNSAIEQLATDVTALPSHITKGKH